MHHRTRRLREIVRERGWTIAKLAEIMERSKKTAQAWHTGARIIPAHSLGILEYRIKYENQEVGT